MGLTAFVIRNSAFSYFSTALVLVVGIAAFFNLGQLEDPVFTIKTAIITTAYPGASPEEVELEVTDRLEVPIQEIAEIDYIESVSRAGVSIIEVNIRPQFGPKDMPRIWEQLRRKIRDTETSLPPGAGRPDIADDFGDVFGFQLTVTGGDFSYAELEDYAKFLRKQISLVQGVSRVDLWGVQPRAIFVDVSQTQLSELGLSDENIIATLKTQNAVVDAGNVDVLTTRLRIEPSGSFKSAEEIGELFIRPTAIDAVSGRDSETSRPQRETLDELIQIRDIGTVRRGYQDPPFNIMRYNGQRAIGISIANRVDVNIVDVGKAIDKRLEELVPLIPVGIHIERMHWQSDIVDQAVRGFLVSFAQAVAIVLIVLTLAMGWRAGFIIGTSLIITILGTFIVLSVFGIPLQRMSLGALIISLGMMVDNSIVVADGIAVRLRKGMDRTEAAIEAASLPSMPLLGATFIALLAFYPVFGSEENAGEYCATLFIVVAVSLLISWVVSMTVTPLQCIDMLKVPQTKDKKKDPFSGRFYGVFRKLLEFQIRARWLTIAGMYGLLALSIYSFQYVEQLFFPISSMQKFMVDIWAPEGTRIQDTAAYVAKVEKKISSDARVTGTAAYIGQGPPRFYLPLSPEKPYPSYAQLIINVKDNREIPAFANELQTWIDKEMPEVLGAVRLFDVGPSFTWKFAVRIIGPDVADRDILSKIAAEVQSILDASPLSAYSRTDWRNRVQKVVPVYNQERGRWAAVSREDVAKTTKRAFDGRTIGLYREKDDLIPIVLRHVEEERGNVNFDLLQVQRSFSSSSLPLAQVTDGINTKWEDPLVWRRDRRRTIKVEGNPHIGVTLPALWAQVGPKIEALKLPPGYKIEWDGEFESARDAKASLIPAVIPAVIIVLLILVGLFNAFRPPLVIIFTIPLAAIGVVWGLILTDAAFGFVALLGAMSLAGMMVKNAIVLLDEVSLNLQRGLDRYEATIQAAVSRLSPVVLAAATTVLGLIPLLQDLFWVGLSVAIMAGLSFGTILTMLFVPTMYATLYGLHAPAMSAKTAASRRVEKSRGEE
jgi:multidrug efflux pump subunit AcrB